MPLAEAVVRHDMHAHIWRAPRHPDRVPPGVDGSVEALLADMTAAKVSRAAIITPRSMGWDDGVTLDAARAHPDRLVAVVRCDLESGDAAERLGEAIAAGARGVRIAADDGPLDRLLDDDTERVRAVLRRTGIPLALHAYPADLDAVDGILRALPGHPVLLDHLGRPSVADGVDEPIFQRVLRMAAHPGLHLKTPDVPFFTPEGGAFEDLVPFLAAALEAFGPARIAWGSDWPLCVTAHDYSAVLAPIATALEPYRPDERELVWSGNFDRLYG
ncbi:MAG: amidohydrolase family protein [Microbacteriaceae bacterium]|nr:amidohydrolase family protein [Microbacteriaceae bacterium]